jgi:hypothetical protein
VATLGAGRQAAEAQQPDPAGQPQAAPADAATQAELRPLDVSPRGALLRALLVPGWGHTAIGAYTRGGFYFGLETATAYALVRTRARLSDARERAALRESILRARYANEGVTDPAEIQERLEADEALQSIDDLVSSREAQQEDLLAWGIFLVLIAGADAYVSAHLARFPTPIDIEAAPTPDGGAEISLRVPFP